MAKVSSSNTTTLYSTTQTTPIVTGAPVTTGGVNNSNFTTLYSQSNGVPGGGASDDLLVKGNLRVLGTSDLEGQVTISNSYSLPTADGTNGQVMATNGTGQVTFVNTNTLGKTYDITASSTANGANFNLNSDLPTTDTIKFAEGANILITATSANEITIATTGAIDPTRLTNGIYNFQLETTGIVTLPGAGTLGDNYGTGILDVSLQPAAGGLVTVNSNNGENYIEFDDTNAEIGTGFGTGTPYVWRFEQSGATSFPNYTFPLADGTANQVLETDGTGNLSWVTPPGTTYTIDASSTTGGANFNLAGSDLSTDTIKFAEGSNVTITATSANEITISATGPGAADRLTNGIYDFILNGDGTFTLPLPDTFSVGSNPLIFEALGGNPITLSVDGNTGGYVALGDGAGPAIIGANGANDLLWLADPSNPGGQASFLMEAATGDVVFGPGPTGVVRNNSDYTYFGTGSFAPTITTNGAYSLTLNTNNNTATPSVVLTNGGGITLNPSGANSILINSTGTGSNVLRRSATTAGISNTSLQQRNRTNASLAAMDGDGSATVFGVRDQGGVTNSYTRVGGTYSTTNDFDIFFDKSSNSFTTSTRLMTLKGDRLTLGPLTGAPVQTITTGPAQDLVLSTDNNTASPQIYLEAGGPIFISGDTITTGIFAFSNGSFTTAFEASGSATADDLYVWPDALPPISGYLLSSDDTGVMSWIPNSAGSGSIPAVANTLVERDSDANSFANNTFNNLKLFFYSSGTASVTTLTAGSEAIWVLSGTSQPVGGIIIRLPDATTLPNGAIYTFYNANTSVTVNSAVRLQNAAGVDLQTLNNFEAGQISQFILRSNSTTAGIWVQGSLIPSSAIWFKGSAYGSAGGDRLYAPNTSFRSENSIIGTLTGAQMLITGTTIGPETFNDNLVLTTKYYGSLGGESKITIYPTDSITANPNKIILTTINNANVELTPNGTGRSRITNATLLGGMIMNGSTSGTIAIAPPAVAGTQSYTLPTALPAANGYVLSSTTAGVMSWTNSPTFGNISIGVATANTIASTNSNGNLVLEPNGTGDVYLTADTTVVGDANALATITTNGTGDLVLSTNSGTNSGSIGIINGVNGAIVLTPNGTGDVYLSADTTVVGDINAAATVTTNGTGDLILNTNSGTSSGAITITQGSNGNVTVVPNGTGQGKITNLNYNEVVYTAGSTTGTITPDVGANGTIQAITLTGSITFNAFNSPVSGQTITLIITQPASGGPYTLTSTMKFAGASKTLSTAANAIDILTVSYIGTTYYASLAKGFA
jgi:hypothetical protein